MEQLCPDITTTTTKPILAKKDQEMKPEQQRIAIAEACGWKSEFVAIPDGDEGDVWINPDGFSGELPNYLNDFDAMNEAEKVLTPEQEEQMNDLLWDMMEGRKFLWRSTATQRAEAFLKSLDLWT